MTTTSTETPVTGLRTTVAVVAGLHLLGLVLLGWGLAGGSGGALTLPLAATAYLLGLRHAVDADHIAMIDNSTRKLLAAGQRPASVGLAFSAGHSTVVVAAGLAVVVGAGWVRTAVDPGSQLALVLGVVGGRVSALYLLAVAAANLPQAVGAWRSLRDRTPPAPPSGPLSRALAAPLSRVRRPAHIYPFGILFGLGFDTASTIALLMLTGAGVATGLGTPLAMLALPVLFAAAMTLGDSANALVVLRLYTAADQRHRALANLLLTGLSVLAAVLIAVVTLAGLVSELWPGAGADVLAGVDTGWWGVGLVVALLLVGLAMVRRRRRTGGAPADG